MHDDHSTYNIILVEYNNDGFNDAHGIKQKAFSVISFRNRENLTPPQNQLFVLFSAKHLQTSSSVKVFLHSNTSRKASMNRTIHHHQHHHHHHYQQVSWRGKSKLFSCQKKIAFRANLF